MTHQKGAQMLRRGLLVGGLGLSLTLTGAGALNALPAAAQDTSAGETDKVLTVEERVAAWEEERLQRYERFLAAFAENLGIDDTSQVETAYKEALKQLVEDELAAGDISANAAAELKERIDAASGPILFGGFGGGRDRRVAIFERDGMPGRGDFLGPRGGHGPIIIEMPRGAGGAVELAPADDPEVGEVDSLPADDGTEGTPTK